MSFDTELTAAIAAAMKARDRTTLSALRMLKAALTTKSVEKGRELDDAETLQVVHTLVKQRRDSIEQFTKGGRADLAAQEAAEIQVLERYLPAQARPEEIAAAVEGAIAAVGATSVKDLGRVMKEAMARLAGRSVDGKAVNEAARARLTR
jgi:uncharacterized protein YqeY